MIKAIKDIFNKNKKKSETEYSGVSDFFLRASDIEKKKVLTEAAYKANEDQLRVFNEAQFKLKTN